MQTMTVGPDGGEICTRPQGSLEFVPNGEVIPAGTKVEILIWGNKMVKVKAESLVGWIAKSDLLLEDE